MEQQSDEKKNYKAVYTVVTGRDDREHWVKLGAAFTNRDGSLTVRLNAVPVNGKLVIRERRTDQSPLGVVRFHGKESLSGER